MPPGNGVRVELGFSADSWVEVIDARGERLVYGLREAGQRDAVEGAAPISVLLGNADGVSVVVDGGAWPIPARGRRGNLAEFEIGVPDNQ